MSGSLIDEIRQRLTVEDALSRAGVVIKRRYGRRAVGLCPIHSEKTPSFTVYIDRWNAHCFGCGWHGDMIDLLAIVHHRPLSDVIRELAAEFGLLNGQPKRQSLPPAPPRQKVREEERTTEFAPLARVYRGMTAAIQSVRNEADLEREDVSFALERQAELVFCMDRIERMTVYDFGALWRAGQIRLLWEAINSAVVRKAS